MTRQFHARMRRPDQPRPRDPRPHLLSFKCFRFVSIAEPGPDAYDIIELCEPRNAMSALVFER